MHFSTTSALCIVCALRSQPLLGRVLSGAFVKVSCWLRAAHTFNWTSVGAKFQTTCLEQSYKSQNGHAKLACTQNFHMEYADPNE